MRWPSDREAHRARVLAFVRFYSFFIRIYPVDPVILTLRDGNELRVKRLDVGSPMQASPVIVFLNGSFFDFKQWDLLVSRLTREIEKAKGSAVLLLSDYRGFGHVAPLNRPFAFGDITRDVIEILEKERVQGDVHLVGMSLGSLVGVALLGDHPSRFRSLTAYGFATPVSSLIKHVQGIFLETRAFLEKHGFFSREKEARVDKTSVDVLARALWQVFVLDHSKTPDSVKRRGYMPSYGQYIYKYTAGTHISTLDSFLEFFTDPTLPGAVDSMERDPGLLRRVRVFHGKDDLVTPVEHLLSFNLTSMLGGIHVLDQRGHTDIMLDADACDAIASSIVGTIMK